MKPQRKVANTSFNAFAVATPVAGQGSKPVRDKATPADAAKSEYKRKVVSQVKK